MKVKNAKMSCKIDFGSCVNIPWSPIANIAVTKATKYRAENMCKCIDYWLTLFSNNFDHILD